MASAYSLPPVFSAGLQLLSALLVCLLLQSQVHALKSRRDQVSTLISFKAENSAPDLGYWLTWRETDENPCDWVGVGCTVNSTVSMLKLSGWMWQNPTEATVAAISVGILSNLEDLRELDLSINNVGDFEGIGNLTGLILLNLSSNILTEVPDLGNLTRLELLDLSYNKINFEISPELSACVNLRSLFLQSNYFDGGIPSLQGLARLQILSLADNSFSGPFPQELGKLTSLVTLDVSRNFFNGTIPSFPSLSRLVYLNFDENYFTEFEAEWFVGANFTLYQLTVSSNQLHGGIPSSITKLQNLQVLDLSHNSLSGSIPFGFSGLLNRGSLLDLSSNSLTGKIPADMISFVSCSKLNLSRNHLTGDIPEPVDGANGTSISCYQFLDLSHNRLSGALPLNIFGGVRYMKFYFLYLNDNQLSGDIVDVLLHNRTTTPAEVFLQNNLLTGDLSRIADMNPTIAPGDLMFPPVLNLSNNSIQWSSADSLPDPIQATLGNIVNYSSIADVFEFWVGGNNFSGTSLPKTCFCTNCRATFTSLDLSSSHLNGEIFSAAFDSTCLPELRYLDLSNNHIRGRVPESIVTIASLRVLDLSNNSLTGPLPPLQLNGSLTDPSFYVGNELCGYPLDTICPGPGSGLKLWVLLVTICGSLSIALMSCAAATWRWSVYHRKHQQDADLIRTLLERDAATLMPLRELRKATDNFAQSAQIGQGGFGTVYIGKLNDGTVVAIKRSKREGSKTDKQQFLNEVKVLSQVNHRNLVKLIGCCMENKVAVLVFEFVSNGTLQEHLQGKMGATRLTWKQRLNIAVQTAEALSYLHSAAMFPIYHRDVKSANILLDDELNAKVADFGISRLAPLHATHVSTVAVQGTMGYIDPEYYTSYQLTDKSDVYSFGVVLLELISAKPALDFRRGGDESNLVNLASLHIEKGDLEDLLDPALTETYIDLAGHGSDSILCVAKLAMACVNMRSKARPNMSEVLKELQILWLSDADDSSTKLDSIRENYSGARHDHAIVLSDSFRSDGRFSVEGDSSGIQLSQFSRPGSF